MLESSLSVPNLIFLLPLGITDANKQRFDEAKGHGTGREQSLELHALGLKSSHSEQAISKAKEPPICPQAGKQETFPDVDKHSYDL